MTGSTPADTRILGSLRSADGQGIVRIEDRFDTDVDDLWSALTDPHRLARWVAEVEGDLRPGGEFSARFTTGWEGTGRVEACEPPKRLVVVTKEAGETAEEIIEAVLTAEGEKTNLVIETRGITLEYLPAHGAGWQVHVEDLAAYLAGRERCAMRARWLEIVPAYREMRIGEG